MATITISPTVARRMAITRQRLAGPRPEATPDGIMNVLRDLRCLQIDPIRAVERTQLLVLWSRLGNYDPIHLDTLLWQERRLFEYWAHAASIVLTEDYPIHQAQMVGRFARDGSPWSQRKQAWLEANEAFRQYILTRLRQQSPLSSDQFEDLSTTSWQSNGWTDSQNVSQMLGFLWTQGDIMVAERNGLRRKWALTEQHLPDWTPRETLSAHEVVRQAAQISLRALGVGTAKHIANHFIRGRYPDLSTVLAELEAEGVILPISIRDNSTTWPGNWHILADDLPLLERLMADSEDWQPRTTLLSPFDNLICDRERTELLWDFHFRLEIYVPRAKRQYGYYVLPILRGDRLIGRLDPKMDRKTGTLHINAVYSEPDIQQDSSTGQAIAGAIAELARFLGARNINYGEQIPKVWMGALR